MTTSSERSSLSHRAELVTLMHPREILATHYLIPELLKVGSAVCVQGSRAAGNDLRLELELAVLEVDAGTAFLKDRGDEQINLLGNSGLGLFACYAEQANLAPERNACRAPGQAVERAAGQTRSDGFLRTAFGPGHLAHQLAAPPVTNENDLLSIDPPCSCSPPRTGTTPTARTTIRL